jgi:GrpB-like predicted nucleotidyltransferase (UPF0157 family)
MNDMSEFSPAMRAGDPILVIPYDPRWPVLFAQQAADLRAALGQTALRIDHIGSTAIPGLHAKPIIDIQISVTDFEPVERYQLPLESLGYVFRADNPDRAKRYFREPAGRRRTHIHVRRAGSFGEQFALLFRDYLRVNHEVAAQYGELKLELARRYPRVEDRATYTEAKSPFIWNVMARADAWAQQTGWCAGISDA